MADVVYELMAKIGLDDKEFNNGLKGAGNTLKSWGSTAGKVALTGAKVIGAGIAAGATAVVALTKSAVDGYAEYEQLVGGIETLFGAGGQSLEEYADSVGKTVDDVKDEYDRLVASQETVMDNASEAWKTAGLSASEYMDTAIGVSGALLKSLGGDTAAAADLTQTAIVDMADQANKYGKTVEEISQTYTSLARGNTQTLDNLFGGMFAGTKSGLEEMLRTAEQYRASLGETVHYSADSYGDIVRAIHDISEMTGVAGTTAEEASTTIQGSLSSMRSAWKNLVTGLADGNADIEQLIDDLLVTIIGENGEGGVINNIMPAVERALNGIVTLITTIVPKITPIITDLISQNLPMLVEAGMQLLIALISGIIQGLPQLIETLPQIFDTIKTVFMENWPALKEAGGQLLQMIGEGIIDALGSLDEKLAEVGIAISTTIDNKWEEIKQKSTETWNSIKEELALVWENLKTAVSDAWESIKETVSQKIDDLKTNVGLKFEAVRDTISKVVKRIKNLFSFDWSLPDLKLPHITYDLVQVPVLGTIPDPRTLRVEWYKKAYDNPYMFTKPTTIGFGDGIGGEMVYGHNNLMNDIKQAMREVGSASNQPILITIQSVLDGRVIGESTYNYLRSKERAYG